MPQVEGPLRPTQQLGQSLLRVVGRKPQRACEVVPRAEGHHSQPRSKAGLDGHKAADHLVNHAVSPKDHERVVTSGTCGKALGIASCLGHLEFEGGGCSVIGFEEPPHNLSPNGPLATMRSRIGNHQRGA